MSCGKPKPFSSQANTRDNRPPFGGLFIGRIKMTPSENTRNWEHEKRKFGWKLVQVWLPPESIKRLDALATIKGGRGKAIEELLR